MPQSSPAFMVLHGFALAARPYFMVSGHVAFPEQSSPVLACATEMLARLGGNLTFVEPGTAADRDWLSMNV